MAKIRVLNERLINKIAAGEVVERPASALKEIMENALDAGATELRIDLETGGKKLIRVIDNGEGMDPDDLLLALERHATSKIKDFDDLEEVATLGFRGEAIPSISAVSRMTIRSRVADRPDGREAIVEGGVIKSVKPYAMAPGTTIEVRGIFYNVPARRKFLRTTSTELAHCQNVLIHYAMAFPEVTIRARHNGRDMLTAPKTESTRDRIAALLGNHMLERLLPFDGRDGNYEVMGFVSDPGFSRADTSMLQFFVNRRVVRDKLLIHAVRSAYEDLLPKGRTPIAFVFLELPAVDVDVNVHPSKTEVRFKQSSQVHQLVVRSIRSALSGSQPVTPLAPDEQKKRKTYTLNRPESDETSQSERTMDSLQKSLANQVTQGSLHRDKEAWKNRAEFSGRFLDRDKDQPLSDESGAETGQQQEKPEIESFAVPGLDEKLGPALRFELATIDPDSIIPLGQIRSSYIVASFAGGMLLIDQHAAHERVLFEQLQKQAQGTPQSQMLLHPVIVSLPPAQALLAIEHADELASLGFDVDSFGPGSIALRSLPASLEVERAQDIFEKMAADLQKSGKALSRDALVKEMVVSASCHGAIKINTPLNMQKMKWLLESLFECDMPMRCPHGRPVVLTISDDELRQRFGRS